MGNSLSDSEAFAAIFDLDGTLIDTAADLAASMNHVLTAHDRPSVPAADVRGLVGYGARALIERGFGEAASDSETASRVDMFLEHYESHIAVHSRPFDHVLATIVELARDGARFAICTNKREHLARRLLEALSIDTIFEVIIGADTLTVRKPDPAPVLACLTRLNVSRGVFFGDSDTDIAAATNAGLPCLLFEGGYGPIKTRDAVFAQFSDYRKAPALVRAALATR